MDAATYPLRSDDLKDLENVSENADGNIRDLDKVSKDLVSFNLWWDHKVPENKKSIFNFVSLKTKTDSKIVQKQITTYRNFFERLLNTSKFVRENIIESNNNDCKELYNKIKDLIKELDKLKEDAKTGKKSTSSSTIYELHRSFIKKHEKLEGIIKRAQSIIVAEGWKKASEEMQNIKKDMEIFKRDTLEKFKQEKNELLEENKKLQRQQKELSEKNEIIQREQEKLLKKNKEMQEKQEHLIESIELMKSEHKDILLESEKRMKEQQDKLIESIEEKMQEQKEEILKSNAELKKDREELLEQIKKISQK